MGRGHCRTERIAGIFSCYLHSNPSWAGSSAGAILVPGIMYGVTVHSPAL